MKPVFFTDRDLGKLFPSILKQARISVETHSDHFSDNSKDEEWLTAVGSKGWFVLTRDKKIGLFVLVGKATHAELAQNFIATKNKIFKFIKDTPRPFIAKIFRPSPSLMKAHAKPFAGTVEKWL